MFFLQALPEMIVLCDEDQIAVGRGQIAAQHIHAMAQRLLLPSLQARHRDLIRLDLQKCATEQRQSGQGDENTQKVANSA